MIGSSRKVKGFKPGNREGKISNKGKEILVVPITIADAPGDLGLVWKKVSGLCIEGENSMPSNNSKCTQEMR